MSFYLQALKAEIANAPMRPVDQDALDGAIKGFASRLPAKDADRLLHALRNRATASDEDLCPAGSTLLHAVARNGDRDREVLARWGFGGK